MCVVVESVLYVVYSCLSMCLLCVIIYVLVPCITLLLDDYLCLCLFVLEL